MVPAHSLNCCWLLQYLLQKYKIYYTIIVSINKQARSLESIILDGAKRILGCSSKTCNEAVRGDMGLDTLQSRRDRAKLKWWYKLASLLEDRYPKQLFNQEWNIKPRRGRQRKVWSRMVDDLFKSLDIIESVDSISRDEQDVPLLQYITNA